MVNEKSEKDAVALSVPSKGGEPPEVKKDNKKKSVKDKEEELSEEDRQKKEELELLVQRAQETASARWNRFQKLGAAAAMAGAMQPFGKSWLSTKLVRCDTDLKLTTYNVLSPRLASPQQYPSYAREDLAKDSRWPKILNRMQKAVDDDRIIALQEVDLEWAGNLHAFFAERGYAVVFAQYGKQMNGYMGVMMAWPTKVFQVLDVELCKLTDTAPKRVWPRSEAGPLARFGYLTYQGLTDILGCRPPEFETEGGEWKLAQGRMNEAILVRLRPRATSCDFCVATYHMPCLFGTTEKVRAVNIHSQLLLNRLKRFAAADVKKGFKEAPVALMGDFNIKPGTSSYRLIESGGSIATVSKQGSKHEVHGLEQLPIAEFPDGLRSAYKDFHGQEPMFTNYAMSAMSKEAFVDTLDYIWFSPGRLKVVACQQLPKETGNVNGPFPNADSDQGVAKMAMEAMVKELKESTSSMTSVPKPLKFLRPHYSTLTEHYAKMPANDLKRFFADVLSILSTTMQKEGSRQALKYRLEGTKEGLTSWGHEYIRNIAGEIGEEFKERTEKATDVGDLLALVEEIVPFNMQHNAEVDAVDLLCEVDQVQTIEKLCEEPSFIRVCLYLQGLANFAATQADKVMYLNVCMNLYLKYKEYVGALRIALKLNDAKAVAAVFGACEDRLVQKQMAFMISRRKFDHDFGEDDELKEIASGESLSKHFISLAKELDVLEPKLPEQIYKSHLEEKRSTAVLDSAKQNLASSFVNAFVNAGFCKDELMTIADSKWVYKNKDQGMMSTVGSLGALLLWGIDEGLTQIDKYQWSSDVNLKAGALLAFGLVTCGVKNECDPAWALLGEQLEAEDGQLRLAAVVGLGYAYAGSCREDLLENLTPMIVDTACSIECSAMAAVSLGLAFVSSCNDEVAQAILQTLIERQAVENALSGTWPHFFAVGLGLLYLGQQDAAEATLSALDAITHPVGKYAKLTVEGFAFAYSGDVLHVQKMLQACTDHLEEAEAFHQATAVLGIALIAFGEEIGAEMACRSIDHILQYGELTLRRAVPIALAILHLSNPKVLVIDTLAKLSHDADQDVATGAIMSMGLIGAGTNNARLAGLLRQLAAYYAKDPNALFMVRIAQGLLYMGKGLLTINPLFSDRYLVDPIAFGSLAVLAHSVLHLKNTILGKSHYLLYNVVPAMRPRWLITVDEDMNELKVAVRVGQAVDVTGMAGRPKQITGFQTRTTPVLLNFQDRAELATEEYLPVTPGTILEDFVILKKNPNYKPATGSA
ncbi:PSMD2 [Symbiodinium sp. CCMP2592]|nr:PSMD2 [Symbiodinium sp. CCMP2592]